ncbi:MAG: guanine deaminase [Acidobacteriota bacterium]
MTSIELLRAPIFHTPGNPFAGVAPKFHEDGALVVEGGRIAASGDFTVVRAAYPNTPVTDLRGGFLLPGFIDTHVHFPQLRVLGGLGYSLLTWLEFHALPEEARMGDAAYAREIAKGFVRALLSHGTTTALTFGAHFADATGSLFEEADRSGMRMVTGLVVSDRLLRPELHRTPEQAYVDSKSLIDRFHAKDRLLYAVTPRFALSASEAMLEVCQSLMRDHPGVRFQSHLNENCQEVAEVARLFPWASDYLAVYERFGLSGPGAVMAHNVHPNDDELTRMAGSRTAVSHCPCSNSALGSGMFPLRRHIEHDVKVAMGTDVGGGTGFGMIKEGLQAYMMQRLAPNGMMLTPAHLLYLATKAGAEALLLDEVIGDFEPGKSADFVYLRPPQGSPLAEVISRAGDMERVLAAIFTLAGSESIREVRVEGSVVHKLPEEAHAS